nr:hypothetical protein [Tanacetum cinerariifolium]
PVTIVVPRPYVTRPRLAKNVVTKSHPPPRRTINLRLSSTHSNFHHKVTTAKAPQVKAVKGVKGNWNRVLVTKPHNKTLYELLLGRTPSIEDVGAAANFSNMETTITVSPIPTTRVHNDHPVTQIIGDLSSATQIRSMTRMVKDQGDLTLINNEDFHTCMFACFLSQKEPKRVHQALKDPSWIEAMQEELLQFKMQKVWVLVDFPKGKRAIGTKWVFRNKKDERGIVIRNKARLVTQGHTQEEGIDYVGLNLLLILIIFLLLAFGVDATEKTKGKH